MALDLNELKNKLLTALSKESKQSLTNWLREVRNREKKAEIQIPEGDSFECIIQTPQHRNGKVHKMLKQKGTFYKSKLLFVHSGIFSGHNVQFKSTEQLKESLIKVEI